MLALSSDTNPADGLHFETMIQNRTGHVKQLIPCKQENGVEETVISTAGVPVGSRHYIQYMSVKQWAAPGEWTTNDWLGA